MIALDPITMGILVDIGKAMVGGIIKWILKTAAEQKKEAAKVEKTLNELRNELYRNRDRAKKLIDGKKLHTLKVNDSGFAENLSLFKTDAMSKVSKCPSVYKFKPSKKIAPFLHRLSIVCNKIDSLKELSQKSDRALAQESSVRVSVRVNNIYKDLHKLITEGKIK